MSRFAPLVLLLALSHLACGPELPIADAGAAASVAAGSIAQLDGSASTAPEVATLAYAWSFSRLPPGSRAELNDANLQNPSFTADLPGEYEALLIVRAGELTSAGASVIVTATTCGAQPPAATVSTAGGAAVGATVALGADVTDLDDEAECNPDAAPAGPITYAWRILQKPPGSAAALNDDAIENPSFLADVAGPYHVELVVTDAANLRSAPVDVVVDVPACGDGAPSVSAVAGAPTDPAAGATVSLGATVSDPDNEAACGLAQRTALRWRLVSIPAGSRASLNDASIAAPSFVADVPGAYDVELTATDDTGRSAVATTTITASACGATPPAISGASPSSAAPDVGELVLLTVDATDPDDACLGAQPLRFAWRALEVPSGSLATLNDPGLQEPSFVPDVGPGRYVFEVAVTDPSGRTTVSDPVVVDATDCGGRAPAADIDVIAPSIVAAGPAAVAVNTIVQASPGATADPDAACRPGDALSYRWELLAAPAGSQAALSSSSAELPWFQADVAGSYTLRLVVDDGAHASSPVTFIVNAS